MSGLGLIKSSAKKKQKAEQEAAVEMLRTDDYFNPTYFKDKKFKSIGSNAANLYAQNLRKALRGIGTAEENIFAVFGKLFNKCNVSEVAASYFLQYNRDLQADLSSELTDKEITDLMNIINDLPNN
jgi:hypothetical protein